MKITSRHNERIKAMIRLHSRKYRDLEGRFIVEGVRMTGEALSSDWPVECVVYASSRGEFGTVRALLQRASAAGIEILEAENRVFSAISQTEAPQGILAVVRKRPAPPVIPKGATLVVVLDGVQDPGNLGTVLRSAAAAGADAVISTLGSADLYNAKCLRSAAGAIFHVPAIEGLKPEECVSLLKNAGLRILVTDPRGGNVLYDCDMTVPLALVVGNEGAGVGPSLRSAADSMVHIPMPGRIESLNAAVAASLVIFEAVRQRAKTSLC
ncbi:MAG: TrmH family RNA methyltransferase [Bacillota bacterium]